MAVKIPEKIASFITGKVGWVATASRDGMPNVSIKGSVRVLDDEHLVATHAEAAIGKPPELSRREVDILADRIEHDEVVAEPVHLGEAEPRHRARRSSLDVERQLRP